MSKRKTGSPNEAVASSGSAEPLLQPSLDLLNPNTTPREIVKVLLSLLPQSGAKHDAAAKKLLKAFSLLTTELDARSNAMAKVNESLGAHHPIAFQFRGTTFTTSNNDDGCENGIGNVNICADDATTVIQMPEECFVKVMGFLNGRDIVNVSIVNKAWLYISRMPTLWETLDALNGLSNKSRRMNQKTLLTLLGRPQFSNLKSLTLPFKVKLGKTTIASIAKTCPLLEVWNVGYGRDAGRCKDGDLVDAAEKFTNLTSIRTNMWDVTSFGIVSVAKVMGTKLLDLRIENDGICNHYLSNGVLAVIAEHCPNLNHFAYKLHSMFYKVDFDWLTGAGIRALVRGCRRLEVLELEHASRIEREDFESILNLLAQDPGSFALRKIDLIGYSFTISDHPLAVVDDEIPRKNILAGKGPLTASIMRQLLSALCLDPMLHHLLFKAGERATTHAKSFPTMNLINFIALATVSSSSAFSVPRVASVTNRVSSLNARRCGITDMPTRRDTLQSWLVGASTLSTGFLASPDQVMAFSNKISNQYDDRPKQRGSKPAGLGVSTRKDMAGKEYLGLKPCGAAPNCFCSTDSVEDSPETSIPPFKWPTNQIKSREAAFQQLYEVVNAYQPGQTNIDGGGFDIVTHDPKAGYIYVQFESLKNGYVDDFEFAFVEDSSDINAVQVRSSSRLGYLDFGVNAKRINFLAKELRSKGWDAPGVQLETHRGYAEENGVKAF